MKLGTSLVFSIWFTLESVSGTFAEKDTADDATLIQQVIAGQLEAFAEDDAAKALTFAVPEIQESFPAPDGFLAMVEQGYPMVYRHSSFRFLEPQIGHYRSFQVVRIADLEGNVWMVVYQLLRQDDGSWLIGSVLAFPGAPTPDLEPPSPST